MVDSETSAAIPEPARAVAEDIATAELVYAAALRNTAGVFVEL